MKNKINATKKIVIIVLLIVSTAIFAMQPSLATYAANEQTTDEIYYGDALYSSVDSLSSTETEIISYATKSYTIYTINKTYPEYYNTNTGLSNTCANVAGSNVIGFYDRYYDELIPNCTVGFETARYYMYQYMPSIGNQIQGVINDLYVRMGTNNPVAGTTQTQYKAGLTSYVNSKNRSTSYSSVMTGSSFDLNKAITQFEAGNPITLFLSGYNFTKLNDNGSVVSLNKIIYEGNHIAVAYGYQKVEYYNSNGGLIKSKTYLYVATGFSDNGMVYIVNNNGTLNDAEAVHIS